MLRRDMEVTRHFLGRDGPALPAAADWLLRRHSHAGRHDLAGLTLVLPSARAGRRLIELLATRADGREWTPPRVITPGALSDTLLTSTDAPTASVFQETLALAQALRALDAPALAALAPTPHAPEDWPAWFSLAEDWRRVLSELASEGLSASDAAARIADLTPPSDAQRWEALADLEPLWDRHLDPMGLVRAGPALREALRRHESEPPWSPGVDLILIAVAELPRVLAELVRRFARSAGESNAQDGPWDSAPAFECSRVTSLIFASQHEAPLFDDLGLLLTERWAGQAIELPEQTACISTQDAPAQAIEVVRLLCPSAPPGSSTPAAGPTPLLANHAVDEVTVGLADEAMASPIERALLCAGLPVHSALGRPALDLPPATLLRALAVAASSRDLRDLAALARHPDFEAWAHRHGLAAGARGLIELLDEHRARTLQRSTEAWPLAAETSHAVRSLCQGVQRLIDGDQRPGGKLPLRAAADAIARILAEVYEQTRLRRDSPADAPLLAVLTELADALEAFRAVPDHGATSPRVSVDQAILILLQTLRPTRIPEPVIGPSIEMLGWLELALDDAPALILTGCHEAALPRRPSPDPLLPDSARSALGLENHDRRFARDLHALRAILLSRDPRAVFILTPRHGEAGEALSPSRLLLTSPDDSLPRRILHHLKPTPDVRPPLLLLTPGQDRFGIPTPDPARGAALTSLRVTAFRDYLADPYRFYLRHLLRLTAIDDDLPELDAASFGNLAHDALAAFARSEERDCPSPERIARALDDALDRRFDERFGANPHVVLLVQREQLRLRLHAFAQWQARQFGQGWRILPGPSEADLQAPFPVDDRDFLITGRIDRIDHHPSLGFRIIDYKTSDSGSTPAKTHHPTASQTDQWTDLQLPLYLALTRATGITPAGQGVELGYLLLPRKLSQVGFESAPWDEAQILDAHEAARQVVRDVWAGRFTPSPGLPRFTSDFADICLDPCVSRPDALRRLSELLATAPGGEP